MKTTNFLILLAVAGVGAYLLYEKATGGITSLVSSLTPDSQAVQQYAALNQGSTSIDSYNPNTVSAAYFVYNANGGLSYNSDGSLMISTYPPGTPQNPYPNPSQTS